MNNVTLTTSGGLTRYLCSGVDPGDVGRLRARTVRYDIHIVNKQFKQYDVWNRIAISKCI